MRQLRFALITGVLVAATSAASAQTRVDGFDPGANSDVEALAVQPDGKIFLGGQFTTLGGGGTGTARRMHLGRVNADGSLDTAFDPAPEVERGNQISVGSKKTSVVRGRYRCAYAIGD